ncbi:MAG: hypothetical protein NTX71_11785 [Candidatus Aureabacteria bacterium]|nr:hypothetical protein [Candidatus Auribacterota bacterium]
MKYLWYVLLLVLSLSMAGCFSIAKMGFEEATGQKADVEVIKPITADLKTYKNVEVEKFTSGVGDLAPAALVDELQNEVIAAIKARGLFPNVGPATGGASAEPTLVVGGMVTDYKAPDKGAKRVVTKAGLFSVNTFVKDKASGQELGRAIARGRLTSMFRGDETSLMKSAAASVAKFINEAHTPTPSKMQQLKAKMGAKS